MKGTLSKTKDGWMVKYTTYKTIPGVRGIRGSHSKIPNHNHLPLHPDDCKRFNANGDSQSCNVEFDIVEIIAPVEDGTTMYKCAKLIPFISDDFQIGPDGAYEDNEYLTKPGFVVRRLQQMLHTLANEEFEKVGDEGLFPNHTDKDIWTAGFKAGYLASQTPNT